MKTPTECDWEFPEPHEWPPYDNVALGADLQASTLLYAYSRGLFPMYDGKDLWWWSPVQRGIIPLDNFHASRSLRKSAQKFTYSINRAFTDVMLACASEHTDGQWITSEFVDAYGELHQLGYAHSVEVWNSHNELVGGVYGVRINRFFAGESMFHRETDASKAALFYVVQLMQLDNMTLFDTQWLTPHLASLGAIGTPRDRYLAALAEAVAEPT